MATTRTRQTTGNAGPQVLTGGGNSSVMTSRRRTRRRRLTRASGVTASTAGGGVTPTIPGMSADQRKFYELGQRHACELHGIPFRATR